MLALVVWCLAFVQDCPDCNRAPEVDPPVVALKVLTANKADGSGLLVYDVVLTNRSAAKAFDVKVKLDLPEKTTLHKSTVDLVAQQNLLTWNIGTMPGNCQRSFQVTLKTTSDGPVEACFRVSYEHGVCVTTTASCKPKDTVETLPKPKTAGQLTVQKIGPARQGMGIPILYSITVTNSGKIQLNNVELDDIFPPNAVYVPSSADNNGQLVGPESKKMQWRLGTMLPGDTRTVTFKVRPTQVGTYLNVANANGLDPDGQRVVSKDSTTTTDISGMATIYMEVKDSIDPLFVGNLTSYSVLVRNTGTAAATNIKLHAEIPAGMMVTDIVPVNERAASSYNIGEPRINFQTFNLAPNEERIFIVSVKATRENLFRFRTNLTSDVLDPNKPVISEEETTNVVAEKPVDSLTMDKTPEGKLTKK